MTEREPPRVENAPGIVWRERKVGWVAEWHARTDLVRRGFKPKSARVWDGEELTDAERAYISDQCNLLQTEMLIWGRGGIPELGAFNGTLGSLISFYQKDPVSTYQKLRYRSRLSYDNNLRRIARPYGEMMLSQIKARTLLAWHAEWVDGGKVAMAHSLIGTLRTLFGFGATMLEDAQCERLSTTMHRMRFPMSKSRVTHITAEQVIAIREAAHSVARPSIALAQALQFECALRQKDVVGEWVPLSEPGTSDVIFAGGKWLRGLRWSEIDKDLVLHHTTSKRQKDIKINLKLAPMVMEELNLLDTMPDSGPIIINDVTGLPYRDNQFRFAWRKIAKLANVPMHVFNMDTRAGAITEALGAGALLQSVRKFATHSEESMTQKYNRDNDDELEEVMKLRAASRNKKGTEVP